VGQIVEKTALEIRSLIRSKALSPVEVFDAFRAQIEKVNPAVNAFVTVDFDRARREARRAEDAVMKGDPIGLLHGLPVGIKDVHLTAGLRTTFGSLVYKDNVPDEDELMVKRIRAAGGIVMGKTNTPEFGTGANTINRIYGATVNPFALSRSASGSSGGSAAALATDMVPLATGTDQGGSLRTPASFCAVVGHRPSPGACPTELAPDAWSPLTVDGPMARNVRDAALLMAAVVGRSADDPISQDLSADPFLSLPKVDTKRLRVAFSGDLGCVPVSQDILQHFGSVAKRMAPMFGKAEWSHPEIKDLDETFEALRAVGYAHTYGDYVGRHRHLCGSNIVANVEFARRLSLVDIGRAHTRQSELFRSFQAFFRDIDILVCPAASVAPFPVNDVYVGEIAGRRMESYIRWVAITYAITLSSHSVTVIPAGLGPTNLPFGIQIVGRHRDDVGTLAAAAAIEGGLARDPMLARPRPDLRMLSTPGVATLARSIPPALAAS
jgi:Asp-tRNA(Asn)/Glu-tRNA(Gln) amidotransferase A subunit family amidase